MSKSGYKVVKRSDLFYGRFAYRVTFRLTMAGRTAYCYSSDQLKHHMTEVRQWYRSTVDSKQIQAEIDSIDWDQMNAFFKFKRTYAPRASKKKDNKVMITVGRHQGAAYITDLKLVRKFEDLGIQITEVVECDASLPREIRFFKKPPKHKYRIYFKSKKTADPFKANMLDFLDTYKGIVFPSYAFVEWLKNTNKPRWWHTEYLQASHFIEYDDEGHQTILLLMFDQKYFGKCFECRQETTDTVQP